MLPNLKTNIHYVSFVFSLFISTTIYAVEKPSTIQSASVSQSTTLVPILFETRAETFHIRIQKVLESIQSLSSLIQRLTPFITEELDEHISLLNFEYFKEKSSQAPAYKRTEHFGGWAKNKKAGNCYNTRAKVLIRDNVGSLKFKDANPCSVIEGQWNDPYAGDTFTDAQAIQIDHMVPLKEAYVSGGYKWNFKERCLYGNYLGYNHHLIAVDGEQNNEKGDQSPIDYMPSRKEYQCEYIKDWLTIKALWGLSLTPDEQKYIIDFVTTSNCDKNLFTLAKSEIKKQQKFFQENLNLCEGVEKLMLKDSQNQKKKNP